MRKIYMYRVLLSYIFTFLVYLTMPIRARYSLGLSDASIFEYFGYAMTRGEIPYQNLFDHKGPVIFFINYLGYSMYGDLGIKIIYLLCLFTFFYTSTLIARLFTNERNIFFILLVIFIVFESFFELGWGIEGYVLPLINYSLYVYLKYFLGYEIKNIEVLVVGVFFSIVFFTKANMIGVWIIFSIYVLIKNLYLKEYIVLTNLIKYCVIGALIIILPMIGYLTIKGTLYEMFYQSFMVNYIYVQNEGIGKRKILEWFIIQFNSLNLLLITVVGVIISYKKYRKKTIFFIVAISFCVILTLISKRMYLHYLIVLVPLIIPMISVVVDKLVENRYIYIISIISLYVIYYTPIQGIVSNIDYRNYNKFSDEESVAKYIKNNTKYDDKIYSHRMQGLIYLESDRLANSKFFFIPSLEDETPIIDEFKSNFERILPKYVVLDSRWDYNLDTDKYIKDVVGRKYKEEYSVKTIKVYKLSI